MEKDVIISLAKSFLSDPYSEDFLKKLSAKNPKKFFNNLSKLDERQIVKILNEHPEYANMEHDGWHALHYAATLNDHFIVEKFITLAIRHGLTSYPRTEKFKKDIPSGMGVLEFCAAMNCDKSLAKFISHLDNPEKQDYGYSMQYAMLYNSTKTIKFLQKIVGQEKSQEEMLAFFNNRARINYGYNSNFNQIFEKHFKYNPERLEDYGVDIKYEKEGMSNYFSLVLKAMSYHSEQLNEAGMERIQKCISYFIDKGFSFDKPDGKNEKPRDHLNEFIKNIEYHSSYIAEKIENFIKEIEYKSLNNELSHNVMTQPKKIKI
jgi:hypothetical protein